MARARGPSTDSPSVAPPVAVRWAPDGDAIRIIDQRRLPAEYIERDLATLDDVCDAIATLAVRGAPAIGLAAAMGLAAEAAREAPRSGAGFRDSLRAAAGRLRALRPTAVNLAWAIDRLARVIESGDDASRVAAALRAEADAIAEEDRAMCRRIGEHALPLLPIPARVLTHCNAGALATAGIGTALAPLYLAAAAGRPVEVFVPETRPLLQGSRLTAWELSRAGIPVTVVTDGSVAALMRAGRVDCCIVGADRIAANGDVANKIGTYAVAVAARHHDIPFYVAAPTSTFDPRTSTGDDIVIEQRARHEVASGVLGEIVPASARVDNPAFDVTPAALITAIVSDRGVFRAPYAFGPVDAIRPRA
jgi:methylthioribose-1-phosphate isomerase